MKYLICLLVFFIASCSTEDIAPVSIEANAMFASLNNEKNLPPCSEFVVCIDDTTGKYISGIVDIPEKGISAMHGTITDPWAAGVVNRSDQTLFGFNMHNSDIGDATIFSTPDFIMVNFDGMPLMRFYRNGTQLRISMILESFGNDSTAATTLSSGDLYRVGNSVRIN